MESEMKIQTICQYCSAGCSIGLNIDKGKEKEFSGNIGVVNKDGFICQRALNGYRHLNNPHRLTEPMLKTRMGFRKISFDEACFLIEENIREVNPDENYFFAGAQLSNEELYLVQKIARAGVGTNNLASFHYMGRGTGYLDNSKANIPVSEIIDTQVVYIIGDTLSDANPFTWSLVKQAVRKENVKIIWVSQTGKGEIAEVANEKIMVHSVYSFLKSVNRFLIESELADNMFTDEICIDYIPYKENMLSENSVLLLQDAGIGIDEVAAFVKGVLSTEKATIIFTEEELSGNACREVHHLAMLTGKMGHIADGIIAIRESANSQGLIDMGIHPCFGQGGVEIEDEDLRHKVKSIWGIDKLPARGNDDIETILNTRPKNLFIFGEDPVGEASKKKEQISAYISKAGFSVVQDFYMTPTAELAELIIPATYLFESGGTYTNTQKIIQQVNTQPNAELEMTGFELLANVATRLGLSEMNTPTEALLESVMLFPAACSHKRPRFVYTNEDNNNRIFSNGATSNG
jgi:predicted molibdopterin-dependent oxidoreductase YjgC